MLGNLNKAPVEIEEVTSILTPAEGVTLERALKDANLSGYDKLEVIGNEAHITWFKRK